MRKAFTQCYYINSQTTHSLFSLGNCLICSFVIDLMLLPLRNLYMSYNGNTSI